MKGAILLVAVSVLLVFTSAIHFSTTPEMGIVHPSSTLSLHPSMGTLELGPLSSGQLFIHDLSNTGVNKRGQGDDLSYDILSLSFPSLERVESIQMKIDGIVHPVAIIETITLDDSTVLLVDKTTPYSQWFDDGMHTLAFRVQTNSRLYEARVNLSIDSKRPSFSRDGKTLRILENNQLEGVSIHVYSYNGIEDPILVEQIDAKGSDYSIDLEKTHSLVIPMQTFRVVSVSDDHGNLTHYSPDDARPFEEIMREYRMKRVESSEESFLLADAVSKGKFGPIYIFNVDSDTQNIPGNVWSKIDKENNLMTAINEGGTQLEDSGKSLPYDAPVIEAVSASPIFLDVGSIGEWGLKTGFIAIHVTPTTTVSKKIIMLDQTDSINAAKFYLKMADLRAADPTRIPVVMIDHVIVKQDEVTPIAAFVRTSQSMYVNYSMLGTFQPEIDAWEFDYAEARITLAHEMGHGLGLGHASDPDNLLYPTNNGGTKLDKVQDAAAAAKTKSEGLLPKNFADWTTLANGKGPQYVCSNRLLERGKPNSSNIALWEDAEDHYAGFFAPSESPTVEISDWVGNSDYFFHNNASNSNWKACPILDKYLFAPITGEITGKRVVNPPIAVPNSLTKLMKMQEIASDKHELFDVQFTPSVDSGVPSIFMCGCFTPCEIFCEYGKAGASQAASICTTLCKDNPSTPTDPNILYKFLNLNQGDGGSGGTESCAANTNPWTGGPKGNFKAGEMCADDCAQQFGAMYECKNMNSTGDGPEDPSKPCCYCAPKTVDPPPPN